MAVIIGIIVLAASALIIIYNTFIRRKNLAAEAWSGIDVQLKRRYDLIPNLIETVKGYMQHERGLLEEITGLRSKAMGAEDLKNKAQAENALSSVLKSLFAVAESYPDLKASQNFIDLQKNLADIEDQLQLARRYYNGTVRDFNIIVESFPSNIIASVFGFKNLEFFEIEESSERAAPKIKF